MTLNTNLDEIIDIYYSCVELTSKEIKQIFKCSTSKVTKLKKPVLEEMKKRGQIPYSTYGIVTKTAFEVWKLDIDDIEERAIKLRKHKK